MNTGLSKSSSRGSSSFRLIADAFLSVPGLSFSSVLSTEPIERVFSKHDGLFDPFYLRCSPHPSRLVARTGRLIDAIACVQK
ncbi:MAG: hypothetical protein ACI9G1_002263 [Pirellulaceae bacterium]|jgi:hypothetical protein